MADNPVLTPRRQPNKIDSYEAYVIIDVAYKSMFQL
jgi:hypothetical protein